MKDIKLTLVTRPARETREEFFAISHSNRRQILLTCMNDSSTLLTLALEQMLSQHPNVASESGLTDQHIEDIEDYIVYFMLAGGLSDASLVEALYQHFAHIVRVNSATDEVRFHSVIEESDTFLSLVPKHSPKTERMQRLSCMVHDYLSLLLGSRVFSSLPDSKVAAARKHLIGASGVVHNSLLRKVDAGWVAINPHLLVL